MSTASVINAINKQTLNYTPAVIAGVQAAETTGAAGDTKLQAVVNGVIATSGALESSSNVDIAGISALVNLVVSIFNATGIFNHKKAAPAVVAPAPVPDA